VWWGSSKLKIAIVNPITLTTVAPDGGSSFVGLEPIGHPHDEGELNIVEMGNAIAGIGNEVTIYISDAYEPEIRSTPTRNISIEYLPTHLKRFFGPAAIPFIPGLFTHIRENDYDVVLTTEVFQWGTLISALASIGKRTHVVIWQEVDVFSASFLRRTSQIIFWCTFGRLLISLVDGFVGRTTNAMEFLKTLGVPRSKMLGVISTGVNTDVFRPVRRNGVIRNKLQIDAKKRVITSISTLDQHRGLELLISAMKEVASEIPETMLMIIGKGPLKPRLDALIDKLDLRESVKIHEEHLNHEEVCALMNTSAVVVVPTLIGFLPFVALECIACGRPVVSVFKRGLRDFVKNGTTGFLVEYNVEDISRKIKLLLRNPKLSSRMGHNALELCKRTCDMRVVANKFVDLFRGLCYSPNIK
jgi:glycosyltransferase involved in cell wall biosynthesis